MDEFKVLELDTSSNYDLDPYTGNHIIDAEPNFVTPTKFSTNNPKELEEGECPLHS